MNSLRPELLELTPQALTALSNAGAARQSKRDTLTTNIGSRL